MMIKMLSGNFKKSFFLISAVRTGVCAYMDATLLHECWSLLSSAQYTVKRFTALTVVV